MKWGAKTAGHLERIEGELRHAFRRRELLWQALLHRSYAHEQHLSLDNEPLEFLGDAVLGFLVAERIVRRRADLGEGSMTRLRSSLVNTRSLAQEAEKLDLGAALLLGHGEQATGGRNKPGILADAFEAVTGALFLDGGVRPVRSLVIRLFRKRIEDWEAKGAAQVDPKTELQELCQGRGWPLPVYQVVDQTGPDHARHFVVEVLVRGDAAGRGEGTAKQRAEQQAARGALQRLRRDRRPRAAGRGAPARNRRG